MILRIAIYYLFAIAAAVYAARRGGAPERWVASMVMVASVATSLIPYDPQRTFQTVLIPLLGIDVLLLIGVGVIALCADRFWPMYFCAIHLLAVALHGVRAFDPTILPVIYARMGGELSYPVLALLAIGTWRHWRRGSETDWSWQVSREAGGR